MWNAVLARLWRYVVCGRRVRGGMGEALNQAVTLTFQRRIEEFSDVDTGNVSHRSLLGCGCKRGGCKTFWSPFHIAHTNFHRSQPSNPLGLQLHQLLTTTLEFVSLAP